MHYAIEKTIRYTIKITENYNRNITLHDNKSQR